MSRLGAELYSLHQQGETEFLKSLVIRQQLKIVEEAESQVIAVIDRTDAIQKEYVQKKRQLRQKNESDGVLLLIDSIKR